MFYSSQLLSRKSPLGIVWLASHSEGKKLKRNQVGRDARTYVHSSTHPRYSLCAYNQKPTTNNV